MGVSPPSVVHPSRQDAPQVQRLRDARLLDDLLLQASWVLAEVSRLQGRSREMCLWLSISVTCL
jgi:hypothetical protein